MLDHLGIYKQIRAQSFVHEYASLINLEGDPIGKIVLGSEELYGYPALRLHRNSLRRVLLAEADRLGIEIRYGMRCIRVQNESIESVSISFENGKQISADLVVGTDGTNSCVRDYVDPRKAPKFTGQIAIIAFAKTASLRPIEEIRDARMFLGTEGSFAIIPAGGTGEEVMFFSTIETHDRTKEEWQAVNMDKQGLKDYLRNPFSNENWPEIVRTLVKDTPAETFFCWP